MRLRRVGCAHHFSMSEYLRARVAGGTFFFTVVTYRRARFLCTPAARRILGDSFRACPARWPFQVDAIVLLPDHLHAVWSLPPRDNDYSRRWAWIKKEFTKAWLAIGGSEQTTSESRQRRRDHGVWQPRFWEHLVRDE